MNKNFKGFLALSTLAVVMTIASCTKTCDTGVEGSDCKTEMRTKFLGSWTASDSCVVSATTGAPVPYIIINNSTGLSSDLPSFNITNVANAGVTVRAKISNSTSFTIPSQTVAYGASTVNVSGDGSISNNNMTVNVTYAIAGTTTVTCKAVLTK